jgi:dihydropteroate synthase
VEKRSRRLEKSIRLPGGRLIRIPAIMGIINVAPDSFYAGSRFLNPDQAATRAIQMESEGAAIIDVGGESTRPGTEVVVAPKEEIARVIPVIREIRRRSDVTISIDTRKAQVAAAAISAGAAIVNDVSALEFDAEMAATIARSGSGVVLMHMRGTPATMDSKTRYRDVTLEVAEYFKLRTRFAIQAGIERGRIIIDPGLGFAKKARHNLQLIAQLNRISALGFPVAVGPSRKRFVRTICGEEDAEMVRGSAAIAAIAIANGAAIVRVHDPAAMKAAVAMATAVRRGEVQ